MDDDRIGLGIFLITITFFTGWFFGHVRSENQIILGNIYMSTCLEDGYTESHCFEKAHEQLIERQEKIRATKQ